MEEALEALEEVVLEEVALEEVALEGEVGVVMVAMVAHRTGTGTQLGGTQAKRRNASKKRKMKMRRSLQNSLESQEKGACRREKDYRLLVEGSGIRYLIAFCTFFNHLIKYVLLFFNEGRPATFSALNHYCQV